MMRTLFLLCFILITGLTASYGVEILEGANLGNHLYGEEVSEPDLTGKVVFVEYWGINCPPCRASFPHLVKLQADLAETEKFTVFATHVQGLTPAVKKFLEDNKVNFPVYHQARLKNAPCGQGIPSAHLFDHTGKLVASGRPSDLYAKAKQLVKAAPHPALSGVEIKLCKGEAAIIESGRGWAKAIKSLTKKAAKEGHPAAAEAAAMLASVNAYLDTKLEKAKTMLDTCPTKAVVLLSTLARFAAGTDQAKAAADAAKEMQKDKGFRQLQKLVTLYTKLKARKKLKNNPNVKAIDKALEKLIGTEDIHAGVKAEAEALKEELTQYL
jgi:thiol-disulfide isomerase/thioredoxin